MFDKSDLSNEKREDNIFKQEPKRGDDPILEIPKGMGELHLEMLFDRKLKEKATLLEDE